MNVKMKTTKLLIDGSSYNSLQYRSAKSWDLPKQKTNLRTHLHTLQGTQEKHSLQQYNYYSV